MSGAGAKAAYERAPGPPGTRFVEVRRFAEIDSTNRYLLDEARAGAAAGLVAVADHQTAGRGRLGRRWEAPPGANLLASVLLVPALAVDELHLCSVAVALAAAEACRRVAGLDPELKWPNDLLAGGRKLAGILAESVPVPGAGGAEPERRAVVVGVGLNAGWPPPDEDGDDDVHDDGSGVAPVPEELRAIATSIRRETGATVAPRVLLEALLDDLDGRLAALDLPGGKLELAREYRARCSTVGRPVVVVLPDGETRGTAMDITPQGHLVVDVGACFTTITAGDVVHVHPGA